MMIVEPEIPFALRECPPGDRGPAIERRFAGRASFGIWHRTRREWVVSAVYELGEATDMLTTLSQGYALAVRDLKAA